MLSENIIYIGVIISVIAYVFYLKDVINGQIKPNLVSWFIWALAPLIGVFFQLKAGAGLSVIPVFIAGFGPLLVLIFSVLNKKAYWKINSFDLICGAFSLVALIIYIMTKNLAISIIFAIISDGLAAVPTLVKAWKFPETEKAYVYWTGILNNILGLLIIKNWVFSVYSFGIYFILINMALIFSIYGRKFFPKKQPA